MLKDVSVYIDGGIRRGTGEFVEFHVGGQTADDESTDVLKALCLGATAVGLGRPFLYAQSVSSHSVRVHHQLNA